MRLPRDVSGTDLAKRLRRYGYEIQRQTGSHMRLVAAAPSGEHHITIPAHKDLRVGTLRAILAAVAAAHGLEVDELARTLFQA